MLPYYIALGALYATCVMAVVFGILILWDAWTAEPEPFNWPALHEENFDFRNQVGSAYYSPDMGYREGLEEERAGRLLPPPRD